MNYLRSLLQVVLLAQATVLMANIPGGGTGTGANVTVVDNGSTVTLANGVVAIVCTKAGATINQINYTYNNGGGTTTYQMLAGGKNGGQLYWTTGGFGTGSFTYSLVANPSTNGGNYAEISLLSASASNGTMEVHFSMRRGSSGFYVTVIWGHRSVDAAMGTGELRQNIYLSPTFTWNSIDATRNFQYNSGGTSVAVTGAPQEVSLWTSGYKSGQYEDKYKYSAAFGSQTAWGWSSVTNPAAGFTGRNIGIWYCLASAEYFNGGPLKTENMDAPMIVSIHGGHYQTGEDSDFAAGEVWTHVSGPYFVYCNAVPNTITNPSQAANALFDDARAQAAAETTAWPYSWFANSNYAPASNRGTVSGKMVISDAFNPNASAANLWVGVVQQPVTSTGTYDFQQWSKPYQFWVKTDPGGNFTIPNVIAGTNYTLYAFGPGANGTFMSQSQTGGNPPLLYNLPVAPFGVTVTGGATSNLGTVTWTPSRVGPTVFEIGYPDRTARKFRHGEDWWVGDIGPSPTTPSPVWTKFLEYPFDFPNGPNYVVGQSRWSTDWNFIQPVVRDSAGNLNGTTSTITFNLVSTPAAGAQASLFIGTASDFYAALIVSVNGANLGSTSGVTATPSAIPKTGYIPAYSDSDTNIREGITAAHSDERLTFPATLLRAGTNTITINLRKIGGGSLSDHAMYDYLRLELTSYVPPAPTGVVAYAGNNSTLVSWPVMPGATSYKVSRSPTSGMGYSLVAGNVVGPVCGSGPTNASYLDATAQNGVTYYYVVQSVNPVGTSGNSPQSAGIAPSPGALSTPPAAPTGLTATVADARVNLSWKASSGANAYTIQRSTLVSDGGRAYTNLGTITLTNAAGGPTYSDTSPTNGSLYAYTVFAGNAAGTSAPATAVNATPVPTAPAVAPPGVTATPGAQQVVLQWSAVPGAIGYIVQSATKSGGPYTYLTSVTTLSHVDDGLADNTTTYYVITAMNAGGASGNSAEVSALTGPAAPTVTATAGNTQVQLTWAAIAGATSYVVRRGTVSGTYTSTFTTNGPSFADSGLANGTTYYYTVTASNASGTSGPASAEVSTAPVTTVPAAVTNLIATGGDTQVALTWTASAGVTSYSVKRSATSGGPYTTVGSATAATNFIDPGRTNGTRYFYVVTASNGGGASANSAEATAIPGTALQLWRQKYFGTMASSGNAADSADPEGDGRSNLLEYAVGSDPKVNDGPTPVTVGTTGDAAHLTLSFRRIAEPVLTYRVEASDDLTLLAWPSIWTSSGNANTAGPVTITDPEFLSAHPRRFLRLRIDP